MSTKPEKAAKAAPASKKPALSSALFKKKGEVLQPIPAPASPAPEGAGAAPENHQPVRNYTRSNRSASRQGLLTTELVSRPFRITPDTDWSLSEHIHREKGKGRKVTYQVIFEAALQEYMAAHNIPLVQRPLGD